MTSQHGHENMYAKDYTSKDTSDDREGMISENNVMMIRRVINTGMQEVFWSILG